MQKMRANMAKKYCVAVYLAELAYGGPEEGDWWYNCGELVRLIRVFGSEEQAYKFAARMDCKLAKTLNKGRRSKSSVLSEGVYEAEVFEDYAPKHYPEVRPHYE
jgi:hypothetical protein